MRFTVLCCCCCVSLTVASVHAAPVTNVTPNVTVVRGEFAPGSQPDGNTTILKGAKGLIVVDTGRHPRHLQVVTDFARQRNEPVAAVINTHWHLDHIGGNASMRSRYPSVRIYASDALARALTGFLANYRRDLEGAVARSDIDTKQREAFKAELAILDSKDALAPDEVIRQSGLLNIAGRRLDVHLERAVTEGDVWILDPVERVLVAGDLITLPVPFLDTACPSRWSAALAVVADTPFETLVPGHGAPMSRSDVQVYRRAFNALMTCAASKEDDQRCIDRWVADAQPLLAGSDEAFVRQLLDYYVTNTLRNPQHEAKYCH